MLEKRNLELVPYSPIAVEAKPSEIVLPKIYADAQLREVLDGNEFDVTFDTQLLAECAEAAGITNHVCVVLFSEKKLGEEDTPDKISFKNGKELKRDTVFVAVEESPEDIEEAENKANIRFWTAVLASNILEEPGTAQEELEKFRRQIRKESLKRKIGGWGLSTAGVTGKAMTMTNKVFLPAAVVLGAQAAGFGLGVLGRRKRKNLEELHLYSKRFDKHIISLMRPIAAALADEYKVINYHEDTVEN